MVQIEAHPGSVGLQQIMQVLHALGADVVIRDHPYQSIGIAFGVGVLIGVLVARK